MLRTGFAQPAHNLHGAVGGGGEAHGALVAPVLIAERRCEFLSSERLVVIDGDVKPL